MKNPLSGFQDALSFLTVLPTSRAGQNLQASERMKQAMVWFPLVGALLGAVTAGAIWTGSRWWPLDLSSLLGVAIAAVVTGGLHLDGFCDTVDGLGAWKGPEETLAIMRDSRIGALAAVGLFLLLAAKWILFQRSALDGMARILVATGGLSRWSLVCSSQLFRYVPGHSGLGRLATEARSTRLLTITTLVSWLLAAVCLGPARGTLSIAVSAAVTWGFNRLIQARLGGITGDTLGAVAEVVEVILLGALVVR